MGGSTISTSETKIEALKLQSSAYGVTIPVLGGVNRIAGNLVWYGDFRATAHTTTESQGGKGGVKTQNTTYTYSASVVMGICHGPVGAIARLWRGKELRSGGWSPSAVLGAVEAYTVPGSGPMVYTLAHGASLLGVPAITYTATTTVNGESSSWTETEVVRLAEGQDFALAGSAITFLRGELRGLAMSIAYQYGTGAPDLSPLTDLGLSLAGGAIDQVAPSWLSSAHPAESLAYPGLAHVNGQDYSLGTGAQVENHSFEVQGAGAYQYGAALPDCNPAQFTAGLLGNQRYGARMPSSAVETATWVNYCAAAGLLMSPLLTEQVRAADLIDQVCRLTNAAPVWSYDRLRIVPYGDATITGNGATYTPNVTPLYDLDDDHWLQDGNADPLQWSRKEPADRYNHVRIEFNDRANDYNKTIAEAKDDADIAANGLRTMSTISAPWICDAAVARLVAQIVMQRSLNISGVGVVKLPWAYCLLECMDLVTLTDEALGFAKFPVRITSVGEDEDGVLEIEVEEWPLGTASPTAYPSQVVGGYKHDYNAAPGNALAPVICEAPGQLTVNGLELYVAATGTGANWGGCHVWVSLDGAAYKQMGTITGGSRYGTLTAAAGTSGGFAVAINTGRLLSGSAADAAALNTLCLVRGAADEFVAFETATLTSAQHYTLGGTVTRAAYGTAAAAHSSGASFVRIDNAVAKSGPVDLGYVGKTVHVKLTSFNHFGGGEQALADVADYAYVILGSHVGGNAAVAAKALADAAAIAAAAAQGTANTAASNATAALGRLASIDSDNVLARGEKSAAILDYTAITGEQSGIDAQATNYAVTAEKTAYDNAVSALTSYLTGLSPSWSDLSQDTPIAGATFRSKFADVYTSRQAVLDKIAATAKSLVGTAQGAADAAAIAAAAAQGTANTAASNATAALGRLASIDSDNVLARGEKSAAILDYTAITGEQSGIDAQATNYAVTAEKTAYDNAVSALTSYLTGLSPSWSDLSQDTPIAGATFRSKFADVYTSRQAVLDKIAANAKARLGALATVNSVGTGLLDAGAVHDVLVLTDSAGYFESNAI